MGSIHEKTNFKTSCDTATLRRNLKNFPAFVYLVAGPNPRVVGVLKPERLSASLENIKYTQHHESIDTVANIFSSLEDSPLSGTAMSNFLA